MERLYTEAVFFYQCVFVTVFCVCSCVGGGGGTEQEEHQDQFDAKADPTSRGGDEHATNTHRHVHPYFALIIIKYSE